ncbi:hypothetical protein IPW42_18065, partial [Mycobacteroides abscessus subsp. massiliense]|nr:hypothetical protein [Mycobacteroides abscessus subsp. massiliense]
PFPTPPRRGSSTGSDHCSHVNIVLINDKGTLTTVGGGEGRGVGLSTYVAADDSGITGYGRYE